MSQSDLNFHNSAKALKFCEACIHYAHNSQVGYINFELFYNTFIFEINRFWEITYTKGKESNCRTLLSFLEEINNSRNYWTTSADPLLSYVKEARNQLAHDKNILWNSNEESIIEGLGKKENMGPHYDQVSKDLHSTAILPSLALCFSDVEIAAKTITTLRKDTIEVPVKCINNSFENTPRKIMTTTYDFYGQSFRKIIKTW